MAEEVRTFLRSALFGFVIAGLYWWIAGEVAGTILLGAFGTASAFITITLLRVWQRAGGHFERRPSRLLGLEPLDGDVRVIPEGTHFPRPSLAPLFAGLGLALASLTLAWGPGFLVAAAPFLLLAAMSWYRAAVAEYPRDDEDTLTTHRPQLGDDGQPQPPPSGEPG